MTPIAFGTGWWLLIPAAALAAGAAFFAYRFSAFKPPAPWRGVLPALRFASLFLCLVLLLQPVWRHTAKPITPPILAVLLDESLSLASHDSLLMSNAHALSALEADVRLFGFSSTTRALPSADSLQIAGVRTDIAGALAGVDAVLTNDHLRAVLLFSDGRYNTGRNPLHVAAQYPVPIHTVAVGDTLEQRDVQIRRTVANEIGYVDTVIPVEISVMGQGYENQQIVVSLAQGSTMVSTVRTTVPTDGVVRSVRMEFAPETAGLQQLTASITHLDGEATHANNTRVITLNILDNRQRILLVAGAPHPDLAALRALLGSDEAREVVTLIQKDAQSFYENTVPDSLAAYDLIVLVGYPGHDASPALTQQVSASGARLFFVLTEQTDLAVVRARLAESLPVVPAPGSPLLGEAAFEVTPMGWQHAAFQSLPAASPLQLPPLRFSAMHWQLSPDARVLAQANVGGVSNMGPLLVVRTRDGVRTAALLGAGTWRWQNLPEDLADGDGWWPTLLDNLVQWLLAPEDDRRVRVEPVWAAFAGGEEVQFAGQVYNESLRGVEGATVALRVAAPDGTQFPYTMSDLGNGRYAADIGTLPEGSYMYEARAMRGDVLMGSDAGAFTVGALVLEYTDMRADAPLLRQIANRSGGQFLPADDVGALAAVLRADSAFAPRITAETRERALWQWPLLLAAILTLLTTEWVLRKRIGLA